MFTVREEKSYTPMFDQLIDYAQSISEPPAAATLTEAGHFQHLLILSRKLVKWHIVYTLKTTNARECLENYRC